MKKYNRKSIRLKGYDYSKDGLYFITINSYKDQYLFGEIDSEDMILNNLGNMIKDELLKLNEKYKNVKCDEYIIMPNHIHFILEIMKKNVGAGFSCPDNNNNDNNDDSKNPNPNDIPNVKNGQENVKNGQNDNPNGQNGQENGKNGQENPARTKNVGAGFSCPDNDDNGDVPNDPNDPNNIPNVKLGNVIGYFKYIATKNYNDIIKNTEDKYQKLWHRNYYEHIIRDEESYIRIVNHIKNNPTNWNKKNNLDSMKI